MSSAVTVIVISGGAVSVVELGGHAVLVSGVARWGSCCSRFRSGVAARASFGLVGVRVEQSGPLVALAAPRRHTVVFLGSGRPDHVGKQEVIDVVLGLDRLEDVRDRVTNRLPSCCRRSRSTTATTARACASVTGCRARSVSAETTWVIDPSSSSVVFACASATGG